MMLSGLVERGGRSNALSMTAPDSSCTGRRCVLESILGAIERGRFHLGIVQRWPTDSELWSVHEVVGLIIWSGANDNDSKAVTV